MDINLGALIILTLLFMTIVTVIALIVNGIVAIYQHRKSIKRRKKIERHWDEYTSQCRGCNRWIELRSGTIVMIEECTPHFCLGVYAQKEKLDWDMIDAMSKKISKQ